jgi:hypothetical protein
MSFSFALHQEHCMMFCHALVVSYQIVVAISLDVSWKALTVWHIIFFVKVPNKTFLEPKEQ